MTSSSLFKEIDCLNKDIDKFKGKIETKTVKKSSCPPNCYCDKRKTIETRAILPTTRTKTATATVIKTDISPKSIRGFSAKVVTGPKTTTRPKTANNDYRIHNYDDIQPCPRTKRETVSQAPSKAPKEEKPCSYLDHLEPVKLSKKCPRNKVEPSWSAILQKNNMRDKENYNGSSQEKVAALGNSSSSSSFFSSVAHEPAPVYMKSKGVQCEKLLSPNHKSFDKNNPLNTMQYLIMNMKSKLKHDPAVGNMLDEMEYIVRRIPPFDRGDIPAMNERLSPKPNFHSMQSSRERLEATYLELEATCAKLKKERDSAVERASQKSLELIESMRREADTKAKLNETNLKIEEMSSKLETYTRSMDGLTEHVKRLQSENKDLERIRGQVSQLSKMMRDVTQENKSLLSELQLVMIERNKLEVELAMKEQDLERKSKELESVSQLLLDSSKPSVTQVEDDRRNTSRTNHNDSLHRKPNHKQRISRNESAPPAASPQLVSSSPNTSSSDSIHQAVFDSWIAFSTITGDADDGNNENHYESLPEPQQTAAATGLNRKSINKNCNNINNYRLTEPNNYNQSLLGNNNKQSNEQQPQNNEQRPDVNKIEKLKDEIRRMFREMRELAHDVPSIPAVEFSPTAGSSELNWSEMSNTNNSYDSVSDLPSSDFNDFLERNKFKI